MIGKIYRRKGMIDRALQHFTKALDLDPKDTNMVKSLIDKIHSAGPGVLGSGLGNDLNDDDADIQLLWFMKSRLTSLSIWIIIHTFFVT